MFRANGSMSETSLVLPSSKGSVQALMSSPSRDAVVGDFRSDPGESIFDDARGLTAAGTLRFGAVDECFAKAAAC